MKYKVLDHTGADLTEDWLQEQKDKKLKREKYERFREWRSSKQ